MKKSELRKLIKEIIKEQLAPMKGDKPIPTGMTLYTIPCVNGLYKPPSGPISNMNTAIYPSALIDDKTPSQSDVGKTVGTDQLKRVVVKVEVPSTYQSSDTIKLYTTSQQCKQSNQPTSPRKNTFRRPNKMR
jgi:hypothetical protein|tara:strand:+ start:425 stop:820 length:396 start_codon:yes stop_codon:yes gene_type:complete